MEIYGRKDFEKMKVLKESGKHHMKGQPAVQDQSMVMEKSSVLMKDGIDKEHEE